jgi:hypothetical protein
MSKLLSTIRRFVAPTALAAITALGFSSTAHAASRAGSPAADGAADSRSAPSHPHSVTSGACGCAAAAGAKAPAAMRAGSAGSARASSFGRAGASSAGRASLPAHGGYGASSGAARSGRNYRTR